MKPKEECWKNFNLAYKTVGKKSKKNQNTQPQH